jgi:sulfur-oxidizing protein SoxX
MRLISKTLALASVTALLGAGVMLTAAAEEKKPEKAKTPVEEGKEIAFDNRKGNCLACHQIAGGESPGNIGPPLMSMQLRYPNKDDLYKQIWDATAKNPKTSMPPFGKYGALSEDELRKVVDFIYTL